MAPIPKYSGYGVFQAVRYGRSGLPHVLNNRFEFGSQVGGTLSSESLVLSLLLSPIAANSP